MRSILRWAGSKRALLPNLRSKLPSTFGRYIEPFAGSCCLYLDLQPQNAMLSDYNASLMGTWRALASDPDAVYQLAASLPTDHDAYYKVRASFNQGKVGTDLHAAQFLYLNRYCFNGVYRTNRAGSFNVPRGIKTGQLPELEEVRECARLIRRASLQCFDFEVACIQAEPGDLVYLDPPYSRSARFSGEYGYGSFSQLDESRFLSCIENLSSRGVHVMLSYSGDEEFVKHLRREWSVHPVATSRTVAANPALRKQAMEIVATNYLPVVQNA